MLKTLRDAELARISKGLKAKPYLNGERASLLSWDATKGRWNVQVDGDDKGNKEEGESGVGAENAPDTVIDVAAASVTAETEAVAGNKEAGTEDSRTTAINDDDNDANDDGTAMPLDSPTADKGKGKGAQVAQKVHII